MVINAICGFNWGPQWLVVMPEQMTSLRPGCNKYAGLFVISQPRMPLVFVILMWTEAIRHRFQRQFYIVCQDNPKYYDEGVSIQTNSGIESSGSNRLLEIAVQFQDHIDYGNRYWNNTFRLESQHRLPLWHRPIKFEWERTHTWTRRVEVESPKWKDSTGIESGIKISCADDRIQGGVGSPHLTDLGSFSVFAVYLKYRHLSW